MIRCSYCGKENLEPLLACHSCGTALLPPVIPATPNTEPPPLIRKPALNGSLATGILGLTFGAQVMAGMIGAIILLALSGGAGMDPVRSQEFSKTIASNPALNAGVALASGLATIAGSLMFVRPALKDSSPVGAAWRVGSGKDLVRGALLGVVIAVATEIILWPIAQAMHPKVGPLTEMSLKPGVAQITFVILAILVPLPEELLFRGVMYGGYRQSLGAWKAAALTTAIFVGMHCTELIHFLPATLGIVALALGALYMRLRGSAIGPAVAVHVAYNSVIAGLTVLSTAGPFR